VGLAKRIAHQTRVGQHVHAGVLDIGQKSLRNTMNHHHLEGVCLARMGHFANVMTVLRDMIHHLYSVRLARESIQTRVDATRRVRFAIVTVLGGMNHHLDDVRLAKEDLVEGI